MDATAGPPARVSEPAAEAPTASAAACWSDDSPTIASVVKYFLELDGFEVLLAADGLAGLDTARREHPDRSSATSTARHGRAEMVKALRVDPLMADIRILMLTSESSVDSETEAGGRRRRLH